MSKPAVVSAMTSNALLLSDRNAEKIAQIRPQGAVIHLVIINWSLNNMVVLVYGRLTFTGYWSCCYYSHCRNVISY